MSKKLRELLKASKVFNFLYTGEIIDEKTLDKLEQQITDHFKAEYAKRLLSDIEIKKLLLNTAKKTYIKDSQTIILEFDSQLINKVAKAIYEEQKRRFDEKETLLGR